MPERHLIALDVNGVLWNDKPNGRKYPLYGAFCMQAIEMGYFPQTAEFPRDSDNTICWEDRAACVRTYRELLRGLTPDDMRTVTTEFRLQQEQRPNIAPANEQLLLGIRSLGEQAIAAVISETDVSIVQSYIHALANRYNIDFAAVRGSEFLVDGVSHCFTGDANGIHKGEAARDILQSANKEQFTLAVGNSSRDETMFNYAKAALAINPVDPINHPNLHIMNDLHGAVAFSQPHTGSMTVIENDEIAAYFAKLLK